jgi:FAD dependent oxidoreductase TIGR03364
MAKVLIVGAGIFGTMHAWFALKSGHEVVLVERDPRPLSASVRNFGMIAVGGRAAGAELVTALRARELWGQIAEHHKELTFRPSGSILVATNQNHMHVIEQVAGYADAKARGWEAIDRGQIAKINSGIRGRSVVGGLYCSHDAVVEPETVLTELRGIMASNPSFTFAPGSDVLEVSETSSGVTLRIRDGRKIEGDVVFVVPGSDHTSLFQEELGHEPLRRVFLQMARLENPGFELTTSVANHDSLRFYPGYRGAAISELEPVRPLVQEMVMQLLLQQRVDGTLTIGDTHVYEEPFPHEMREDCFDLLLDEVELILGVRPRIISRWNGIYSQNSQEQICVRRRISDRIMLITGPGGRGNTLSPAIAETSLREMFHV